LNRGGGDGFNIGVGEKPAATQGDAREGQPPRLLDYRHSTYGNPVAGKKRNADELAALIEQGLNRGLDVIDAFWAVTSSGNRGSSRALAREQRRAVEAQRKVVQRYERQLHRWRRSSIVGTVVAGSAGSIGVLDLVVEAGGSAGAFGPPALWFIAAGVGGVVAWRARRKLRGVGAPPTSPLVIAPPAPLPRSAVGANEVQRLISVRMQILQMANTVEPLSPGAGDELRQADAQAAGPLTSLAERLALLHQLQLELPDSPAADAARTSALVVRDRLASGCATYEELLAASARLLAAPDHARSTSEILDPAVQAMIAYAHGLQRAAETFE
jgi:hypothetical protein